MKLFFALLACACITTAEARSPYVICSPLTVMDDWQALPDPDNAFNWQKPEVCLDTLTRRVSLHGWVQRKHGEGSVFAILPTGYAPAGTEAFSAMSADGNNFTPGLVLVISNGVLRTNREIVSLAGINFYTK